MKNPNPSPLQAAYKKNMHVLWVRPEEVCYLLRRMNYAPVVCRELSEWIARIMSMTFIAGQRGTGGIKIDLAGISRMLRKMGYCETFTAEIAGFVIENLPGLYAKGQSRTTLH